MPTIIRGNGRVTGLLGQLIGRVSLDSIVDEVQLRNGLFRCDYSVREHYSRSRDNGKTEFVCLDNLFIPAAARPGNRFA